MDGERPPTGVDGGSSPHADDSKKGRAISESVQVEKSKGFPGHRLWYGLSGIGCLWILLFPAVTVTTGEPKPRGTFFDESSLLVHHTVVELHNQDVDWVRSSRLLETVVPQAGASATAWVCDVLRNLELPCYTHSYDNPIYRMGPRRSVYTVLEPAPGADGKECLILTTAHDLSGSAGDLMLDTGFSGLSLALAVIKHLKNEVVWMSKNIILLVADEGREGDEALLHPGIKAFVDDYHTDTLEVIKRNPLLKSKMRHVGVIRAALSLDLPWGEGWNGFQVLTSGFNGELPNMDLLNTAVHHLGRHGAAISLDTCSVPLHRSNSSCPDAFAKAGRVVLDAVSRRGVGGFMDKYLRHLFSMLGFVGSLAVGPSGPHAHFLRHSVDAITIVGLGAQEKQLKRPAVHARDVLSAVLNLVRSISNTEEELHHSFFCYIMLSTKTFVSIGEYAYALGLLLLPLAVQASKLVSPKPSISLQHAVLVVGCLEAFGLLIFGAAVTAPELPASTLTLLLYGVTAVGYLLVAVMLWASRESGRTQAWEGPKAAAACLLLYVLIVTALLNWSLALIVTLTHVPVLVIVRPLHPRTPQFWAMLVVLGAATPPCLLWLLGIMTGYGNGHTVLLRWLRGYMMSGLMNLPMVCLVSIPVHLMGVYVLFSLQWPKVSTPAC